MAFSESSRHERDTVQFCRADGADRAAAREIRRVTWAGLAVNVLLAVLKGVGGVWSGSRVLIADSVHTVSDLATDAAILIGVGFWSAPADAEHPHGHRKIETLVTLLIGAALGAVGIGMGWEAVAALAAAADGAAAPPPAAGAAGAAAMAAAAVSIVSKEILYRWTAARGVALGSSALAANAWHHRSDALSSIPALLAVGGGVLGRRFGEDLWYLDPVGTVVVCFMLLQAAWEVICPALGALVDAGADRRLCSAIRKTVIATEGVLGAHRIRTRVICPNAVAVDLCISVDRTLTVERGHAIAAAVADRIAALRVDGEMRAVDVMVHVDPADPDDSLARGSVGDTLVDWKEDHPVSHGHGRPLQ